MADVYINIKEVQMKHSIFLTIAAMLLLTIFNSSAIAQGTSNLTTIPNLVGVWTGKAKFMLPDGVTDQIHVFKFIAQNDIFLKGEHSWDIPGKNLKSHDGNDHAHQSTESFLGIIAHDGTIMIVEHGDNTRFNMRLLNRYTLDFIATEGGDHPLVGHGVLVREKLSNK